MKYTLSFLALGVTFLLGARPAMAQSQYGGAPAQSTNGRLDAARAAMASPTPAAADSSTGAKKPLTAHLAKDEAGKKETTVFAPSDEKVYMRWDDDTAAKGDKLRVVWIAEDTGKALPKNKKLSEFTQTMPGPRVSGAFYQPAPIGTFPPGKYRAELYENTKLVQILKFTVK